MRIISFFILLAVALSLPAQNNVLSFDGVDDYAFFNSDVGNNIRTIEFWFKPDIDYGPNLEEFVGLVCREGGPGPNIHEFFIALSPEYMANPGQMRFSYFVSGSEYYEVYSERNYWDAGHWYHIAGVFHPEFGMLLFINGMKQNGLLPYFEATNSTFYNIAIASWGHPPAGTNRYFTGVMDDLRLSYDAVYLENFTPICPDLAALENTAGLWNMNEGSGDTIFDNSGNGHHGVVVGASWTLDNPCPLSIEEPVSFSALDMVRTYPNPAQNIINVLFEEAGEYQIELINSTGSISYEEGLFINNSLTITIDVSIYPSGIYYLWIKSKGDSVSRKIIIVD